ncbi:S-layer homology domain-containing protein [Paenibacillus cucumis (ex Kampfer et al. 2016)]|uniref:S-layer homology domain-containing protein n=1 Tax=Paenibacillus cucumis (ex Kampfer et al. 2016) TaxID=1776858 RepID=A0ABS7KMZ2_9BACL|nr:S-layer homology domain-containing protein [Paenibacillus cucumis (ex Kampfer et al. 2016)]MBY0205485.1 S-layer homology domain-containing protein [Paenibacillus cucumis (ex Kampfer et al. 2016)]
MKSLKRMAACSILTALLLGSTTVTAEYVIQDQYSEKLTARTWEGIPIKHMDQHWAKRLFQWGISSNIINGYTNTNLKPDQVITEAEFLKMFYRAVGLAIPNASANSAYRPSENWTEGLYRTAKLYNHPTIGANNFAMRMKPITKLRVAEIISGSQGVHYTGQYAVTYLIGQGLANSKATSPQQFDGESTLTRAEALQWIRQLALHGKLTIEQRPKIPTDLGLLPEMANTPPEVIPDFSTEPVTDEDFNLVIQGNNSELRFGDSKKSIDAQFGNSSGKSIFDDDMYPLFNAHFNQNGELDGWKTYLYEEDSIQSGVSRLTKKGIVLGESTITDVISRYGSSGVRGNGIIDYHYKKMNDGTYQDISIYDRISNMEDVCMIAFLVDNKTQVVYEIIVKSSLKDAF